MSAQPQCGTQSDCFFPGHLQERGLALDSRRIQRIRPRFEAAGLSATASCKHIALRGPIWSARYAGGTETGCSNPRLRNITGNATTVDRVRVVTENVTEELSWVTIVMPVVLPIAIALIGATTSIWIAVAAAKTRRAEINDDRVERERLRNEESIRHAFEERRTAIEEVIDAVVEYSERVHELRTSSESDPSFSEDSVARPNDFRLVGAVSRLATRGQAREVSMAANRVVAAARWGHTFDAPMHLGPMQTVLEQWLLGELDDSSAIAELDKIKEFAMKRAQHAEEQRRNSL